MGEDDDYGYDGYDYSQSDDYQSFDGYDYSQDDSASDGLDQTAVDDNSVWNNTDDYQSFDGYDYSTDAGDGSQATPDGLSNDIVYNADGSYTDPFTGDNYDSEGNLQGADDGSWYSGEPVAVDAPTSVSGDPDYQAIGDGQYYSYESGNIVDADGNILAVPNPDGSFTNLADGTINTTLGGGPDANVISGPTNSGIPGPVNGTKTGSSGGSGGSGGGFSLPKSGSSSSGSSTVAPKTTAPKITAPTNSAKTIFSDQRIGNDRYIVYSDGSSQRIPNYYTAAPNTKATSTNPLTSVGNFLSGLFGGSTTPAVVAKPNPNANGTASTLNPLTGVRTTATPITGVTQTNVKASPGTSLALAKAAAAQEQNKSSPLLLIAGAAFIAFKFL